MYSKIWAFSNLKKWTELEIWTYIELDVGGFI